jgi:hypothetical protein
MGTVKPRRVKPYSGYNKNTPDKLLLDAGVIFKNYNVGTDTYKTAKAAGKCLGATQKGSEFAAVPAFRRMEIDGVHTRTKGDTLVDGWDVSLKTTLVEMTSDNLKRALAVADVKDSEVEGYEEITGRDTIQDADFEENITFIGNILGEDKPIIIQVFNAFHEGGLTITAEDKNNATVECQFYGYLNPEIYDDVDEGITPPFKIYRPKTAAAASTQQNGGNS